MNPAVDITTVVVSKGSEGDAKETRASSAGGAATGDAGGFDMGETSSDSEKTPESVTSTSVSGGGGGVDLGVCESKSSSFFNIKEENGVSGDGSGGSAMVVVGVDSAVNPVSPEDKKPSYGSSSEPSLSANSTDPPTQRHNAIRFLRELFYLTRSLPIDRRSDLYHRMLMQLGTQVNHSTLTYPLPKPDPTLSYSTLSYPKPYPYPTQPYPT